MEQVLHPELKLANLKVSVRTGKSLSPLSEEYEKQCVRYNNFFVLRAGGYVFMAYPKKGHINVTGIKSFEAIKGIPQSIQTHFSIDVRSEDIVVDNSTVHGEIDARNLILYDLQKNISEEVTVSIRPHHFPGAVIRQKKQTGHKKKSEIDIAPNKEEKKGTINLFVSGKFVIVGCSSIAAINSSFAQLCSLIAGM